MNNEYSKYEYTIKHGISGSGEDAKYEYTVKFKGQYFYTLINGGELSFLIPSECIVYHETFLYCDHVAIQLMPEEDSYDTAYAIISMSHLHAFIDGFLRIILDDDLEGIVRWFIDDGHDRLNYESAEEILIECIDPDKCEEENVFNRLEALKSELSDYTSKFKKALLKEWPYSYESDLENICSTIKEIMEDYIQYDELDKHPKYKIPTFKYFGRLHTSIDNSECICWYDD